MGRVKALPLHAGPCTNRPLRTEKSPRTDGGLFPNGGVGDYFSVARDSLIVIRLFQGLETLLIGQEQVTALLKNTGTSSPSGDVALKERRELFGSWREFSASISDLVKVQGHHRID